ncbi:MAG TPA: hypothetical protein VE642_10230 [Pyrinomonadaceae bacterium]|jgi:hypothetical protein|nr:hypothetical protein [Pyrinomonadaceae bacterium]
MIKDSLNAFADSARSTFRGWRGLLLLAALYLVVLACPYFFFSAGVANTWQLAVSAVTALAPLPLFILLAATAHFALPEPKTVGALARRALRDFLKVFLLALPVAALGWLFFYLLGKLHERLPKVAEEAPRVFNAATGELRPAPLHWQEALMSCLWILLFGVVLPLLAAHLWLGVARAGLWQTVKRIHRVAGRAFLPRAVLVYATGLFVFAFVPYFVLYTRTAVSNGWGELFMFGLRLAFTFALTLLGWTITLGALARVNPGDAHAAEAVAPEAPPAEAPPVGELPAPPSTVAEEV